jgi:hypothetical protein
MSDPIVTNDPTGRVWRWGFGNIVTDTVDGMTDVIVQMDVTLTLIDHDLDMQQVNTFRCNFEAPDSADFVAYDDLTTENLREWALLQYANPDTGWTRGREAWIAKEKQKLVDELEKRHRRQNRVVRAYIEEPDA